MKTSYISQDGNIIKLNKICGVFQEIYEKKMYEERKLNNDLVIIYNFNFIVPNTPK